MKVVADDWTRINWADVVEVSTRQVATVDDQEVTYAFFVYVRESALTTDLCMTGVRMHAEFIRELVHQFWRLSNLEIELPEEGE